MQQQGINTFPYNNLISFQSNAFQPHHLGNGAMLHPMQHNPHIPFVQQQYAGQPGNNYDAGLRPPGLCMEPQVAVSHF